VASRAFRFDFVDLRLFIHVAELGSLSRGAERSNLSLAAASTRIKNLEINLGAQLLSRTSRGVALTAPGKRLLHHATLMAQQLDELTADLRQYSSGARGEVRLAANFTSMADLLPSAVRTFLATYEGVEVKLRQYVSAEGVRALMDGAVDLALVAEAVEPSDELEVLPLRTEKFVLITSRSHALGKAPATRLSNIFDYELIGKGDASTRHETLSAFAKRVNKSLKFRVHVGSFEGVCAIVSDGIGIAVVPQPVAHRYSAQMPYNIVEISDEWASRQISLCMRRPKTLPGFVYDLADIILRVGREPSGWLAEVSTQAGNPRIRARG
jgi:DNA-binding transcriptional LysR family regulator